MKKTIFSLALGTFGLGMAEFGIMGVLPEVAHDVGISIPVAGNMISYYACGVVIGAPVMALISSRFSLKSIMLFLAALTVIGNAIFAFSSSYAMLAVGRLVSGFPPRRLFWRRRDYPVENSPAGKSHRGGRRDDRRDDGGQPDRRACRNLARAPV